MQCCKMQPLKPVIPEGGILPKYHLVQLHMIWRAPSLESLFPGKLLQTPPKIGELPP